MAITVYGVDDNVYKEQWSQLLRDIARAGDEEGIASGMAVSVVSGRTVQVATGRAVQAGTYATSDAAVQVALPANTSGLTRIDVIALQVLWTGTAATAGSMVYVSGTPAATPLAPALTRSPGVKWQNPLAWVTVVNGETSLASGDITDIRTFMGGRKRRDGTTATAVGGTATITIAHNLGVLPDQMYVWSDNWNVNCHPLWDTRTATTMQVQLHRLTDGTEITSGTNTFHWTVEG